MDEPAELLNRAYGRVGALVGDLDPADFERPTAAAAWCVRDVLFHLLLDAQRALLTFASPTADPADVDAVSYWEPFRPGTDSRAEEAHAAFVRRAAGAYQSPRWLVAQWSDTAAAAVRVARGTVAGTRVTTQGHVLEVGDFVSTLVVEACVHHLDLSSDLGAPTEPALSPDPVVLGHTRGVLERIAGGPLPAAWSDRTAVLIGTGRPDPSGADRTLAGALLSRLPLLG